MTHQREGIRKAPFHVFIVEDEAVADEVHNLLKQRGHELSPVASENPPTPAGGDAYQRIAAAAPDATVAVVQAAAQREDSALLNPRPNAPRTRADLKGTYPDIVGESWQVLGMLRDIEKFAVLSGRMDRSNLKCGRGACCQLPA